jgi:hypothetical protein
MGMRRILITVATLLSLQVITPMTAQACACGGFVGDQKIQVRQETAIVELAPGKETVTMQFAAETTATKAAWVMPIPGRGDLTLGNAEAFTYLDEFTKPEYRDVRVDGAGGSGGARAAAAPGAAPVEVTQRVEIGPYEVAQLTGSDPSAVAQWLTQNGFTLPANLETGLRPYLSEGWSLTAVRLTAGQSSLGGTLPPLRITFDTSEPVYPMRLSGQASSAQALRLYVLAEHRMDATSPVQGRNLQLFFAGRDPARNTYVTRYDGQWVQPSLITRDIAFTQSARDDPHREVVTRYVQGPVSESGMTWLFAAGIAILAAIILVVLFTFAQRRRR